MNRITATVGDGKATNLIDKAQAHGSENALYEFSAIVDEHF